MRRKQVIRIVRLKLVTMLISFISIFDLGNIFRWCDNPLATYDCRYLLNAQRILLDGKGGMNGAKYRGKSINKA